MTREDLIRTARSYLGTPWVHQGRVKGAGVDCGGLLIGVAQELGLLTFEERAYGRIPDGHMLRAVCEAYLQRIDVAELRPGDVLLMRFKEHPQHLALLGELGGRQTLIHAYSAAGRVVEHGLDEVWRARIVAAYRFPGVE